MRNIGSRITAIANRKAKETAISAKTHDQPPTSSPRSAVRGSVHPGNRAGLNNEKSTYLQHSEGGYFNPRNQTARLAPKPGILAQSKLPETNSRISMISESHNKLDNRLCKSKNSSISILKKRSN